MNRLYSFPIVKMPGQALFHHKKSSALALSSLTLLCLLTASTQSVSQSSGGEFVINRTTIDNGGGRSTTETFIVNGTIGQHDAARDSASQDQFIVTGGFWANGEVIASGDKGVIFEDGFETFTPSAPLDTE